MDSIANALCLHYDSNIIAVIGLLVVVTFLGSKIFQRFGIPQVVGFIMIGVLLGTSCFNLVPLELVEDLSFVSAIALGLIGFDMGGHLRFDEVRQHGRSILFILLFESVGTFALVTAGVYAITQSLHVALVFGALSSATAPAATVDVLAEYDAKGPLTTSLLTVVGLDDALALLLYSIAVSVAETCFTGTGTPSLMQVVRLPLIEIGGSIALGLVAGLVLNGILRLMKHHHDAMAVSIGFVLLEVGLSEAFGFSLILTSMVMGLTVVNRSPKHGQHIRFTIEQAGPVIYVLFFALVGAPLFRFTCCRRWDCSGLRTSCCAASGSTAEQWLGGTGGWARCRRLRDNLGLGLLSQAGCRDRPVSGVVQPLLEVRT